MSQLRINMISESAISVQGHGVHTAYEEMCRLLEVRSDVVLIRNEFSKYIECDIIHIHTVGTRTWGKLLQDGPKKVISAHVVPDSFVGSLVGARFWRPLAVQYLRWFYNRADLVFAVSAQTKRELLALGVKKPIAVLHNSVDTARYQLADDITSRTATRKKYGIAEDTFVVIGAGQVQPRKRVDLFVKAAKALPEVTFVWVGGMPFGHLAADYRDMEKLMATKLPNLIFAGMVELEEMASLYQMADLFWLPSEQETFGLVVVEAAAAGLPVLLRRSDDYADTFKNDAQYGSDESFIGDIRMIQSDLAHREMLIKGAKAIAQRFDSEVIGEALVDHYRSLLDNKMV